MDNLKSLSNEQQLVILLSRITFDPGVETQITALANKNINWYDILTYSIKNKVLGLVYFNLNARDLLGKLPKQIIRLMRYFYHGNSLRNKAYLEEFSKIAGQFNKDKIRYSPLKGIFMIPNMYKDLGVRTLSDIDCMVSFKDKDKVKSIMQDLNYIQGEYSEQEKKIIKVSRKKEIFWNLHMNNSFPYRKMAEDDYCERFNIDFCHGLGTDIKNRTFVDEMLENIIFSEENGYYILQTEDFFIHLCSHLYKEATNDIWVFSGSDINLIKFVDIREFVQKFMTSENIEKAVEKANKNNYAEDVYFTIYYLKEIFNDGYEQDVLECLTISNEEFIHRFNNKEQTWNKNFWERMFSYSNVDELEEQPRYLEIQE